MRHSERGRFNSCPFAYSLEQEGWRKRELTVKADDRTFGIAVHDALKVFYDSGSLDLALKEYALKYPEKKEYKSKAKDFESGRSLLKNYATHWSVADKAWEVLATELADTIEFADEDHSLHIDLIAKNKQTGEVWAWDHKCTEKQIGIGFFKKYELDAQVTRYTSYVEKKYGNCGGFLINAMMVGYRGRMYKGEPAGYYQRFDRQPFSRNQKQIKCWEKSERDWMSLMDYCTASGVWPKHLGSLCNYCDFYELCMASGDKYVLDSLYTKDPLHKQEYEEFNVIDES